MGAIIGTGEYPSGSFTQVTGNTLVASLWTKYGSTSLGTTPFQIFTIDGTNTEVKLGFNLTDLGGGNYDVKITVNITVGGTEHVNTSHTYISSTTDIGQLISNWTNVSIFLNRNISVSDQYDYTIKVGRQDSFLRYFLSSFTGSFTSSSDLVLSDLIIYEAGGGTGGKILGKFYLDVRDDDYADPDDYYSPSDNNHNFWGFAQIGTGEFPGGEDVIFTAIMGDDYNNSFPDGTPIYWLTDNGESWKVNDSNCSGADLTFSDGPIDSTAGPNDWDQLIIGESSVTAQSTITVSAIKLRGGAASLSSKTTIGTDVSAVDEYVETPYADYVDVDYYDAGYAQNDPYVQEGYVGDEAVTTIASSVTVSDTVNYTSDSAVVALGGNSISAELDVSGQGAITIDAKATLASEVDLTVQSTMSASAGLVFSQTTNIAADTAQTQTVGLVFSQSTDLAADFVSTQLGGNLISAGATPSSDAQLTSDSDVLQGGILDATSTTQLNAVGGYVLDGVSSVATDVQFTGIAESIPFIDETLESDFALSAIGANDVSAELDVTGQGAITITASATTGSDVELAGQFQFSAIAELDTVAQATISTQAQLDSLGGLLFEVDLSVASDFASTQTAAITTNNDVDLVSNSNFAIDTTVLIGGILDTASEFVVLDIEPSLFVGGVTNIFQGTSIVTVVGSYLYDVPLIRRLVVAPDSRLASISPESRILGVKSESRINTIITETRGLKVPQDNRTHKIYDGSL